MENSYGENTVCFLLWLERSHRISLGFVIEFAPVKFVIRFNRKGKREPAERKRRQEQKDGINCTREFVASLKYPLLSRTNNESHAGRSIVKCSYSNLSRCC